MSSEIRWVLEFVLTMVVLGWLVSSRNRPYEAGKLQYTRRMSALSLFALLMLTGLTIFSLLVPDGYWSPVLIFSGFSGMALYLFLQCLVESYRVGPEGLRYRKLWGEGIVRWYEVDRVAYSYMLKRFSVSASDGRTIRLSAMLIGLPEFAQAVLTRVPGFKMEEATQSVLEATAGGSPPRLM